MSTFRHSSKRIFQILGICSPYIAVLVGIFLFKEGFLAVLFYHLVLLSCIISINKSRAIDILFKGYHRIFTPLIALGGLSAGIAIYAFWIIAKYEYVSLQNVIQLINLNDRNYTFFSVYACFVNPFLEESFWRGCFNPNNIWPNHIDILFAGYHALAVFPVLKVPFVIMIFLAMTFVGWFFRLLYRRSGGLLMPLLTHVTADIAILFALWKIM